MSDISARSVDLHAKIDASTRARVAEIDLDIDADSALRNRARGEAFAFVLAHSGDTRFLARADHWVGRVMNYATSTDHAFRGLPKAGRGLIVRAGQHGSARRGEDENEYYGWRDYWYISEAQLPVAEHNSSGQLTGRCDRCATFSLVEDYEDRPATNTFYIARGRYAIEFAVCDFCTIHFGRIAAQHHGPRS